MSKIILQDTHCHILRKYYEDPILEIKNAKDAGLESVISCGLDFETNAELLDLKKNLRDSFLKIGLGLHPEEVIKLGRYIEHEVARISHQINSNIDIVDYIGEVGIDLYYKDAQAFLEEQKYAFTTMCKLALQHSKPMSIHVRDAYEQVMEVIANLPFDGNRFNGFIHCFCGGLDEGIFFIELGFKLGIGGIITYKRADLLRQTFKKLLNHYSHKSLDDIFALETDSPYLSPEPIRSEKNRPGNVRLIAQFIDDLMQK